jgi:DNA-directed RNA polymerase beta' subunit
MPVQDIILGIYYLTRVKADSSTKIPRLYYKLSQIEKDYENKRLGFATPIIVPLSLTKKNFSLKEDSQKFLITTFGRLKLNQIFPTNFSYYINDLKYYNKHQISPAPEDIFDPPLSNWQSKNASG